jgi:hypothetical protein
MPGILNDESAYVKLKGEMSAGCDFMSGDLDMAFSRDEAMFSASGELAGYETEFDASVDLSDFPQFAANGGFSPELATDIVLATKERARQKFQERKAHAQAVADVARAKVNGAKLAVSNKVNQESARLRAAAQQKIQGLVSYLSTKERNARFPGEKQAWGAARVAAQKMKVQPNNSVSGVSEFKARINAVKALANKLRGRWWNSVKTATNNAVNYLHTTVNAIQKQVANIGNAVQQLTAVQQLRASVVVAQESYEQAKQAVVSVTLDPIAARIEEASNILIIDDIGFNSGLDALCQKKLPALNITGSFDGKPFFYPGLLQLASRANFVENNKAKLDDLMARLAE